MEAGLLLPRVALDADLDPVLVRELVELLVLVLLLVDVPVVLVLVRLRLVPLRSENKVGLLLPSL